MEYLPWVVTVASLAYSAYARNVWANKLDDALNRERAAKNHVVLLEAQCAELREKYAKLTDRDERGRYKK